MAKRKKTLWGGGDKLNIELRNLGDKCEIKEVVWMQYPNFQG